MSATLRICIKEAREEQTYWKSVGDPLGIVLYGWDGKRGATFYNPKAHHEMVVIPDWVAEPFLAIMRNSRPSPSTEKPNV